MKIKVFFLIAFITITHNCYSQKILWDEIQNNVRLIGTMPKVIKISDNLDYYLMKLISTEGKSQYFLSCNTEYLNYHNFPNNSKLLFKTFDNKIVELTSIYSDLVPETLHVPFAYFPITQSQLETLFTGISKIRLEILSYDHKEDKPFVEYPEIEYKKDKIGKILQTMYTNIEQQCMKEMKDKKKNKEKTLERKTNTSDF
jgi:hypothetical protein